MIIIKSMNKIIFGIAILLSTSCFAQIEGYAFKRPLKKVEKEGYYAIPLLPEITARCKSNLSDIRLYNIKESDTTEIPYLMEWMGTTIKKEAIPFELINDTYNEKCCSYVTLKFPKKQTINQIKLNVSDSNFDKSLKIEGSNDNKQWFTIKEHMRIVGFQNSNENYSYTTLSFQNTEYSYFRIKFDDDGSPRISITEAYAFQNQLIPGNYTQLKIEKKKQTENKYASPVDGKEKTSEIIIDFPFTYLINYITIKNNSKTDFYRNINVYSSNGTYKTGKGEIENWYMINTSVFSSLEDNVINCSNSKTKKIKIEIINYNDEPIELSEIKAYSEQCRLIANIPISDNIYLAYGKENDSSPNYDLIHFKDKIPKELSNTDYGAEQVKIISINKPNQLIENKMWLWIVMGLVIAIIGYFALSMLKKEQGDDKQ